MTPIRRCRVAVTVVEVLAVASGFHNGHVADPSYDGCGEGVLSGL